MRLPGAGGDDDFPDDFPFLVVQMECLRQGHPLPAGHPIVRCLECEEQWNMAKQFKLKPPLFADRSDFSDNCGPGSRLFRVRSNHTLNVLLSLQ